MIIYNKYTNNEDHTWYDSTNVVYSKCYDNNELTKTVKIVFKGGRTYVYRNVDANDYIGFKTAKSNGQALNEFIIKKYKDSCVRINDTDIEKLSELKENFMNEEKATSESILSNLIYHMDCVDKTGEFILYLNNKPIYRAVEGNVSIINLFKSMGIMYSMNMIDSLPETSDENKDSIYV